MHYTTLEIASTSGAKARDDQREPDHQPIPNIRTPSGLELTNNFDIRTSSHQCPYLLGRSSFVIQRTRDSSAGVGLRKNTNIFDGQLKRGDFHTFASAATNYRDWH